MIALWLDHSLRRGAQVVWGGSVGRMPERRLRAVRDRLPSRVRGWVNRAKPYLAKPLDPVMLNPLATEPQHRLCDADVLANELLPTLGLGGVDPTLYPTELLEYWDRGVQAIQFPNQFGPYLAALTRLNVRSYLEIGVAYGGSFAVTVDLLRRFGLRRALAVDLDPSRLWLYAAQRPGVTLVSVNSHTPAFRDLLRDHGPFDLVFIDGDHSEAAVRADFAAVRPHARLIAFHDIVELNFSDVRKVWNEVRELHADDYEFHEFTLQYPDHPQHLGIGLAIRHEPLADR